MNNNLEQTDKKLREIGITWLYQLPFFYTYFANSYFIINGQLEML